MSEDSGSGLLSEIGIMKRMSLLSESYTVMRAFIENIGEWSKANLLSEKRVVIFLMIIKLFTIMHKIENQDNPDVELCISSLKQYLLTVTQELTLPLLTHIQQLKT